MAIILSIIIVNYRSYEYLDRCIKSIYEYNDIDNQLEVIVVDQSGDHNQYNKYKGMYPFVSFVENGNMGYGAGNNRGALISTGRYLLFLNPDTLIIEPLFADAIRKFDMNCLIGLFGYKIVNSQEKMSSSFGFNNPYGVIKSFLLTLCETFNIFIPRYMYIQGADLFVRKEAFNESNRFDEKIFMYCEEKDLGRRIIQCGYSICFFKNKRIMHLQGGSTSGNEFTRHESFKSEMYYYKKYNIDFTKIIKKQIIVLTIKMIIVYCMDKNKYRQYKELIEYYRRAVFC